MNVVITPRSLCIAFVYSLAHVNSAISAGFTGWVSATVVPASLSIATFVASQRFPPKWEINADLVQALLADALGWSSEKWSKASGRATVGLDQVRTRLSMSIPTYPDYIRCDPQSHWDMPAFGYINNEDHRLVEPCGRSPYLWRNGTEVAPGRPGKSPPAVRGVASPQIRVEWGE